MIWNNLICGAWRLRAPTLAPAPRQCSARGKVDSRRNLWNHNAILFAERKHLIFSSAVNSSGFPNHTLVSSGLYENPYESPSP